MRRVLYFSAVLGVGTGKTSNLIKLRDKSTQVCVAYFSQNRREVGYPGELFSVDCTMP